MRPGRAAANGVPVLVRARPELDKPVLHSGELDVVEVTGCGVVLVAFRVLVGVVVSDEREVVESAQMERVLLARGVRLGVVGRPKHDVLDETGLDVGVLEQRFLGYLSSVGTLANVISVEQKSNTEHVDATLRVGGDDNYDDISEIPIERFPDGSA